MHRSTLFVNDRGETGAGSGGEPFLMEYSEMPYYNGIMERNIKKEVLKVP